MNTKELRDQLDQIARLKELLKQCQKYVPNMLKERIERELQQALNERKET